METTLIKQACVLFCASLATFCIANESSETQYSLNNAWFKPSLSTNLDPKLCSQFLEEATDFFLSTGTANFIGHPYDDANYEGEIGERLAGRKSFKLNGEPYGRNGWEFTFQGKAYYLIVLTGHRSTVYRVQEGFLIPKEKFEEIAPNYQRIRDALGDPAFSKVPSVSGTFDLVKLNDDYLALSEGAGTYAIFRLKEGSTWEETCKVRYLPESISIEETLPLFNQLRAAINGFMGGAGSCGSLRSHARGSRGNRDALNSLLFRPWKYSPHSLGASRYDRSELGSDYFEEWGHAGLWNYQNYKEYKRTLEPALSELADFYTTQFSMDRQFAEELANGALPIAVRSGFNSAEYDSDHDLHRALLEGQSVDAVSALFTDPESDRPESVLTYAIEHPELVKFLLKSGAPPHKFNAFGKTPLMYAAQFNQLKSAKLLLEHGANPNAATTWPRDRCYYTLETSNVTPLHYAVRNASKELIELLLDHGAATFIKTSTRSRIYEDGYPIDWLERFASKGAEERNPNIEEKDILLLKTLLKIPGPDELEELLFGLILEGEKQYQEGDTAKAYRTFGKVLNLEPENERGLSDMSLVALRFGALGESLAASQKLVSTSDKASLVANAWFNTGLACEAGRESGKVGWTFFNGKSYCHDTLLRPFLQAYVAEPSASRMKKLVDLFVEGTLETCKLYPDNHSFYDLHFSYSDHIQYIYVFHPSGRTVDPSTYYWGTPLRSEDKKQASTRFKASLVETHSLGEHSISVLSSTQHVRFPVHVAEMSCSSSSSKDYGAAADHPELHVLAAYEPKGYRQICPVWQSKCGELSVAECHAKYANKPCDKFGDIHVYIKKIGKPIALALSAYYSANWVIHNEHNVDIQKVVLGGFYEQKLSGLRGDVPTEKYTKDDSNCKNCFEGKSYFHDYTKPEKHLVSLLGYEPASFQGKRAAEQFVIPFSGPELHVVGVHEGTDPLDDGTPWHSKCGDLSTLECHNRMTQRKSEVGGEVVIDVERNDKAIILALLAYNKTKWIISNPHGARIQKVILGGYHAQSVAGLEDYTQLEVYTYEDSECTNCTKGEGYFYRFQPAIGRLKSITGIEPLYYQGDYTGKRYSIYPVVRIPE